MTQALFFLRPFTSSDPCLFKTPDGRWLFPLMIRELIAQHVVEGATLLVSPAVPAQNLDIVRSWNLPILVSESDVAKHRLGEAVRELSAKRYLLATSYAYMLPAAAIRTANALLDGGTAELVSAAGTIEAKNFLLCSPKGVELILEHCAQATPPNRFAQRLQADNVPRVSHLPLGCRSENFLWELFFAGDVATIPENILQRYYTEVESEQWFEESSQERFLCRLFGLCDLSGIESALSLLGAHINTLNVAAQFHWIQKLINYFPEERERFLEVGCGSFPLIGQALRRFFASGIGVEPFLKNSQTVDQAEPFFEKLQGVLGDHFAYLPKTQKGSFTVRDKFVEDLKLPTGSVNFCFSRTVFEHVMNVDELSRELWRIMAPGGVMIHEIGLNDHREGSGLVVYFDFLKYSKEQWSTMGFDTNLWRVNDFVELWTSLGFEVDVVSRVDTNRKPAEIHSSWATYRMEDLLCHSATIRAVKPKRHRP